MRNLIELNFRSFKFKTAARITPQQECPAICAALRNFVQYSSDPRIAVEFHTTPRDFMRRFGISHSALISRGALRAIRRKAPRQSAQRPRRYAEAPDDECGVLSNPQISFARALKSPQSLFDVILCHIDIPHRLKDEINLYLADTFHALGTRAHPFHHHLV